MSTCLGLYIEENLIKYAKVSKDHDQIKVESFGVKFYDDLDKVIKQIVEETYSYKTPISINLSEEMYNYFDVFAMLSKQDLPKAIKTEFEAYCGEKNYNPNVFETRYAITPNTQTKDRLRVIHISENKIELNKILQRFSSYKLQGVVPVSMSIPSVGKFDGENCLIVNIEQSTTITTIINQNIYNVTKLENGCQEFLDKINVKENSYQKAYEICKETTIYTSEGKELSNEETGYLEDIMPTLYQIVSTIQKIIADSTDKIEKVYITGTGALINNVDLYFEEYLAGVRCEILKPDFVKMSPDINIKDYVEINSAISLALNVLGEGITGMNFKKNSFMDKLNDIMKIEVGGSKKKNPTIATNFKNPLKNIPMDFNVPLDTIEKNMVRGAVTLLLIFVVYSFFSAMIMKQINAKKQAADDSISATTSQIAAVDKDIQGIQNKTNDYTNKINNLQQLSQKVQENNRTKKAIPNLLNRIMYVMPDEVQLTSIKNTTDTHIEIQAQSTRYADLGYLSAAIKTNGILTNVITTAGQKSNNIVTIKIEGDLP